jgi:hypothetical protein
MTAELAYAGHKAQLVSNENVTGARDPSRRQSQIEMELSTRATSSARRGGGIGSPSIERRASLR